MPKAKDLARVDGDTLSGNPRTASLDVASLWLRVLINPLTVVVFKDGEAFVAQGREFDYAADGENETDCLSAFNLGLVATVLANVAHGNPHHDRACPDDVWELCCLRPDAKLWTRGGPSWLSTPNRASRPLT